ncbi:MAG: hypothetical protein OXC11_08635 [Rhodospirillales bacterium]|nr:hypothetical protein [Rhodospirillales bacterium]
MQRPMIEIWRDGTVLLTCSRIELPEGGAMEVYDGHGDEVEFDGEGDLSIYATMGTV